MAGHSDIARGETPASPRRRQLLVGTGFLAALGAAQAFPLIRYSQADFIFGVLRERLPDLRMEPEEVERFARDFVVFYKGRNPFQRGALLWTVRSIWAYLPGGGRRLLYGMMETPYSRFEQELLGAFLMGTDYLESRHDPSAMVGYSNMPDPYEYGCVNALARFD